MGQKVVFPIDQLPPEMLFAVFSHLGVKTLSKCRLVSKKWKTFVEKHFVEELVVANAFTRRYFDCGYDWRPTNCGFKWVHRRIYPNQDNILFNFYQLSSLFTDKVPLNFSALKRLSLQSNVTSSTGDLAFINSLVSLEHLEVYSLYIYGEDVTLSLDRLKVLRIKYVCPIGDQVRRKLQLNTPRLEVVACKFGFANWNFSNPSSVRQIQLSGLAGRCLKRFSNVESIRVDHLSIITADLFELPKLKELHWIHDSYNRYNYLKTKAKFESLLELTRSYGSDKAKVFCLGQEMESISSSFDLFALSYRHLFQ